MTSKIPPKEDITPENLKERKKKYEIIGFSTILSLCSKTAAEAEDTQLT